MLIPSAPSPPSSSTRPQTTSLRDSSSDVRSSDPVVAFTPYRYITLPVALKPISEKKPLNTPTAGSPAHQRAPGAVGPAPPPQINGAVLTAAAGVAIPST